MQSPFHYRTDKLLTLFIDYTCEELQDYGINKKKQL